METFNYQNADIQAVSLFHPGDEPPIPLPLLLQKTAIKEWLMKQVSHFAKNWALLTTEKLIFKTKRTTEEGERISEDKM